MNLVGGNLEVQAAHDPGVNVLEVPVLVIHVEVVPLGPASGSAADTALDAERGLRVRPLE